MTEQKISYGDRVRHASRPEWGIGTVVKVEHLPMNGQGRHGDQRLSIRFPNAGIKTLIDGHAELERVTDAADPFADDQTPSVRLWERLSESDWLSPLARRKIDEAMISLPPACRDAFNSLGKRLSLVLGLYRFDSSGKGLIDWAVAQTGLDDPLTRFSRQELEKHFSRWCFERDQHLGKLLQECRGGADRSALDAALKTAPPAGAEAVRRLSAAR